MRFLEGAKFSSFQTKQKTWWCSFGLDLFLPPFFFSVCRFTTVSLEMWNICHYIVCIFPNFWKMVSPCLLELRLITFFLLFIFWGLISAVFLKTGGGVAPQKVLLLTINYRQRKPIKCKKEKPWENNHDIITLLPEILIKPIHQRFFGKKMVGSFFYHRVTCLGNQKQNWITLWKMHTSRSN